MVPQSASLADLVVWALDSAEMEEGLHVNLSGRSNSVLLMTPVMAIGPFVFQFKKHVTANARPDCGFLTFRSRAVFCRGKGRVFLFIH